MTSWIKVREMEERDEEAGDLEDVEDDVASTPTRRRPSSRTP